MQNFEITFTSQIEATRRAAELVESGVTAKYVGLWDGLYIVEYQANERLPQRTEPVTPEPEPEMQYINRRESDRALWPTFCPIQSEGWVQIGERPIQAGYHSEGDTILVYSGHTPRPADKMTQVCYSGYFTNDKRIWTKNGQFNYANDMPDILAINFSKGDHLSAEEREAWEAEAAGY